MAQMDFKNRSVMAHAFSMVPRADIPRSQFRRQCAHKTTFNAGLLVPIFVDEVLPGDTFNLRMTCFARMSTPVFPIMDNLRLETFFFFVPNRLVWTHWINFMGEQPLGPADSISYTIPQCQSPLGGYSLGTLQDYMGLPTTPQVNAGGYVYHSNLPCRAYNLIWNQWFRDENLQNAQLVDMGDGPDAFASYFIKSRGKRHDYFTSCLPWTQKGGVAVTLPLGTSAPVKTGTDLASYSTLPGLHMAVVGGGTPAVNQRFTTDGALGVAPDSTLAGGIGTARYLPINLFADLSVATAATINQIRLAFQTQKLLERDARGGTRYTEIVRSHFGVISPDARLQRPEYLGGGVSNVQVGSVPQTSGTGASGTTTPQGNLAAFGTIVHHDNGFTQSFTEHGHILGLCSVQADLTYSQGIRKMWNRLTRYDFYFPVFATLGEQAVFNAEIYVVGTGVANQDTAVFGYQERWAEYRYFPSLITGYFRPYVSGTLAAWHLSQNFLTLPALNDAFITDAPPLSRVLAAGNLANNQQIIADFLFDIKNARPMPMYSVPGLIDHF